MYKERDVTELTTGELAKLYEKLNRGLRRVPGGCWEWPANKNATAGALRIQLKAERTPDGVNTEVVKAVDIIRKREGYIVEPNRGYVMSCHNPRCLNPAHQVKRKERIQTPTTEHYDMCVTLREHGWSTYYQISETSAATYSRVYKDRSITAHAPLYIIDSIDYSVLITITNAMKFGKPTVDDLCKVTGLSFESLLPYGFAVAAIECRIGTPDKADRIIKILEGFIKGTPSSTIAREMGIPITQITSFRGSLYG